MWSREEKCGKSGNGAERIHSKSFLRTAYFVVSVLRERTTERHSLALIALHPTSGHGNFADLAFERLA